MVAAFVAVDTERDILAEPIATIAPRCYMRVEHPLAAKDLDLQGFLAYPHLRLYLPGLTRENTSMVDDVLGQYGVHRSIVLETTQFSAAVGVLARTDALLVANAGAYAASYGGLCLFIAVLLFARRDFT